jgi:lysozyme family protein
MATAPKYGSRWPTYKALWDECETKANRAHEVALVAKKLLANKARYQTIEKKTNVPWWLIAALHERESSGNFNTILAQGDPLGHVSTHVPKGMGPYFGKDAFERGAIESLEHDRLNKVIDWRLEKALYWAEAWNGWGYYFYHPHTPSPYLWGASTVQKPGKYIADGVWSSTEVDQQIGVACLLKALADLDHTIQFVRETTAAEDAAAAVAKNRPVVPPSQIEVKIPSTEDELEKQVGVEPGYLSKFWTWLNTTR